MNGDRSHHLRIGHYQQVVGPAQSIAIDWAARYLSISRGHGELDNILGPSALRAKIISVEVERLRFRGDSSR